MKKTYFNGIMLIITLVLVVAFALSIFGITTSLSPKSLDETKVKFPSKWVNAYSIENIKGVNKVSGEITYNQYLQPDYFHNEDDTHYAVNGGTYTIIIANLDPMDEKFKEKMKKLSFLKGADDNLHLTMYIPPVLSACNIYVRSMLVEQIGEIKDYNYIDFTTSDQLATTKHVNATEPVFLDLTLSTQRKVMEAENTGYNACVVTIHFEGDGNKEGFIDGDILIGEDSAVRKLIKTENISLYVLIIISALGLPVLIFLSIIKKQIKYIPKIISITATFTVLLTSYIYMGYTSSPYLLSALKGLSFVMILFAETLSLKSEIKGFKVKYPFIAIASIISLLAFLMPFADSWALDMTVAILTIILGGLMQIFSIIHGFRCKEKEINFTSIIAPALVIIALFNWFKVDMLEMTFYLFIILLVANLYVFFKECVLTEKRAVMLTNNLNSEVERQTNDLRSLLNERDNLLNYISHDLRKPVVSIRRFLQAYNEAPDEESKKNALANIESKVQTLDECFNEVSRVAKNNYIAENTKEVNLSEIFEKIYNDLNPDCEAEGILFQYSAPEIRVFAKEFALTEVLKNLIFNAVEHSECTNIFLSATKNKYDCTITLTDNGKGLQNDTNLIFEPYVTTKSNSDNLGLGLYICKHFIESMNGKLTCNSVVGKTEFIITLPRAE